MTEDLKMTDLKVKHGVIPERAQPKYKRVDLENMRCMGVFTSNPRSNFTRGYNQAIDDIKSEYGDLYVEVK
jgi:hypothetical protein